MKERKEGMKRDKRTEVYEEGKERKDENGEVKERK
jgi:hypothetical protein